jgi:hypothetical protein
VGVQIDDHRPVLGHRRPELPDPGAGGGPSRAERGQRDRGIGGEGGDQP